MNLWGLVVPWSNIGRMVFELIIFNAKFAFWFLFGWIWLVKMVTVTYEIKTATRFSDRLWFISSALIGWICFWLSMLFTLCVPLTNLHPACLWIKLNNAVNRDLIGVCFDYCSSTVSNEYSSTASYKRFFRNNSIGLARSIVHNKSSYNLSFSWN